jgi:hypothetical protein
VADKSFILAEAVQTPNYFQNICGTWCPRAFDRSTHASVRALRCSKSGGILLRSLLLALCPHKLRRRNCERTADIATSSDPRCETYECSIRHSANQVCLQIIMRIHVIRDMHELPFEAFLRRAVCLYFTGLSATKLRDSHELKWSGYATHGSRSEFLCIWVNRPSSV